MAGRHLLAVEKAVRDANLEDVDPPLVELARTLARQMDAAGAEGPGTRLAGTYLTTVRSLRQRALEVDKARQPGRRTALGRLRDAEATRGASGRLAG